MASRGLPEFPKKGTTPASARLADRRAPMQWKVRRRFGCEREWSIGAAAAKLRCALQGRRPMCTLSGLRCPPVRPDTHVQRDIRDNTADP